LIGILAMTHSNQSHTQQHSAKEESGVPTRIMGWLFVIIGLFLFAMGIHLIAPALVNLLLGLT